MKVIKKIILIIVGYIAFILIMAELESIVTSKLGMKTLVTNNIKENQTLSIQIYIIINLIFWGTYYIINKSKIKYADTKERRNTYEK